MKTTDNPKNLKQPIKPIARKLEEGKDFQVIGKGFGHTTIVVQADEEDKILLCKGTDLFLIGISFKKGSLLEKHVTKLPARMVVLHGRVTYSNALESTVLTKHQEYAIPVDEPHWVEASEDSRIILIKNKQS